MWLVGVEEGDGRASCNDAPALVLLIYDIETLIHHQSRTHLSTVREFWSPKNGK